MSAFLAVFLPLLVGYGATLKWCVDRWNAPTQYFAHCWLVPFIAAAVLWVNRAEWREFITGAPGMERFRHLMFGRMVPNLREIGLLSDRIKPAYERVGLARYFGGLAADRLDGESLLGDLDAPAQRAA